MADDNPEEEKPKRAKKPPRGVLLKDIVAYEFLVAADAVEEKRGPARNVDDASNSLCVFYLRYATQEQIETLASRIPHRRVLIDTPGGEVKRVLFDGYFLLGVLTFLVQTNSYKYYNTPATPYRQLKTWTKDP